MADLPPPPKKEQFQIHTDRFLLSELWQARQQIKCQIYAPPRQWQFEIHTHRLQVWELRQIIVPDLPPRPWQFEIHTDRFLLWELRQTRWHTKWQIYPPGNGNFRFILIDSYSERTGRSSTRSLPPENGNLRFILIDSYSESSGRSSGRSIPPQEMAISDSYW